MYKRDAGYDSMDREESEALTALVEGLYTEFYKCMVLRVIGIVGRDAAEDIVQTLMSCLLEYKEPEKLLRMTPQELQNYAMRAVFNMALDQKRRLMREQAWITQPTEEDYTDLGDFQNMEMKELLYHLVAKLPEKEREVMELCLEDPELTQEEIAQRLGLHRITVNRRYKRAVKIMRILYRTQEFDT